LSELRWPWRITVTQLKTDYPNEDLSINQEGIVPMGKPRQTWMYSQIGAVAKKYGFDFDTPIKKISAEARDVLFYGSRGRN